MCLVPGCSNAACTPPCADLHYYNVTTSTCIDFSLSDNGFPLLVLGFAASDCSGTYQQFSPNNPGTACGSYGIVGLSTVTDASWKIHFCSEYKYKYKYKIYSDSSNTETNWCVGGAALSPM